MFPTVLSVEEIERITRSVVRRLGLRREPEEDYIQIVHLHLCSRGERIDTAENPGALLRTIATQRLLDIDRSWQRKCGQDRHIIFAEDTPDGKHDPGRIVPERLDLLRFIQAAGPDAYRVLVRRLNRERGGREGLAPHRSAAERKADSRVLLQAQAQHGHLLAA